MFRLMTTIESIPKNRIHFRTVLKWWNSFVFVADQILIVKYNNGANIKTNPNNVPYNNPAENKFELM